MTDDTSDADGAAETDSESEDAPEPFQNRAARRSKGKSTTGHTGNTTSHGVGRSGTVQSPRQYGNRRSG